jgi:hypothetical protein
MHRRFRAARGFRTKDSALAFYINQLENLDRRLYEPLVSVSWGRDIKLRPGITMSNESTSFIRSSFAGSGTLSNAQGNMPWVSPETNDIPGVSVDGQKVVFPLRLLAREVSYTSVELERSQSTGQPIDVQKINALNELYQMNVDQMVYVGSDDVGATGMLNDSNVTATTVVAGAGGGTGWIPTASYPGKTPDEIVQDIDNLLDSAWDSSAWAVCPADLLLPPPQFSYISSAKVSSAGNMSILNYIKENCIANQINGRPLNIQPLKWSIGAGVNSTDRMMAYTNDESRVRFPMVPIRRETAYYMGIRFIAPYIYAFGEVEFVYPETAGYGDGI